MSEMYHSNNKKFNDAIEDIVQFIWIDIELEIESMVNLLPQ